MAGEFAQLLPFTWRDLHLPISRIGFTLAHDLVEHKYWGVDGGRVESTGVAPLRISAVIPIANSIFPGNNERWAAGALYPEALRRFLPLFADKSAGFLQHPELGLLVCKPERMEFEFVGERQDSTEIHASWVETIDDEVRGFDANTPVQEIEFGASDLAASGTDLRKLAPGLPEYQESLESLGRKLTGIVDTFSVVSYRSVGAVNRILYQAHRLEVSVQRAGAMAWPAIQALQRIKAGAHSLRKKLLAPNGIGLYVVPADTTLAGVVSALPKNTSMAEVIKLNPSLARSPVVSKGAVVRYPIST